MKPLLASLALLLVATACSSGPPYAALRFEDETELGNVRVTNAELHDIIRISTPNVDRVAGSNQLKVMVPIRNIDDEPIRVLVQVRFLDGRRLPIGDDTNRQVKVIGPGATMPYIAISNGDLAQDWEMDISWDR